MSGHELLIMLVVTLMIATISAVLYTQVITNAQTQTTIETRESSVRIIQVIAENVTNQQANTVRFSVTVDEGAVKLNDTLIIISTEQEQATLKYRNGTLNRSITEGYYTQ